MCLYWVLLKITERVWKGENIFQTRLLNNWKKRIIIDFITLIFSISFFRFYNHFYAFFLIFETSLAQIVGWIFLHTSSTWLLVCVLKDICIVFALDLSATTSLTWNCCPGFEWITSSPLFLSTQNKLIGFFAWLVGRIFINSYWKIWPSWVSLFFKEGWYLTC